MTFDVEIFREWEKKQDGKLFPNLREWRYFLENEEINKKKYEIDDALNKAVAKHQYSGIANKLKTNPDEIKLNEIDPESIAAVEAVLRYMYSGVMPEFEDFESRKAFFEALAFLK